MATDPSPDQCGMVNHRAARFYRDGDLPNPGWSNFCHEIGWTLPLRQILATEEKQDAQLGGQDPADQW